MNPKVIGFLGYEGVQGIDLVGPLEAFMAAAVDSDDTPSNRYKTCILGLENKPFVSETGIVFQPHMALEDAPQLDTLIIPGGRSLRFGEPSGKIADWLVKNAHRIRRIVSVCTGIYALAPTGFLDGKRVTTHWNFAGELAKKFPKLKVEADAIFIKDGKFYTSAGTIAGIDLSLALIEEDFGSRVALAVARNLVIYMKRPGGQEQFSEPLRFQSQSINQFTELVVWMRNHLRQNLTVESLAERANLCPRHFSRRFKEVFGTSPAVFVETLRLDESRLRLTSGDNSIEEIGSSVGFKSARAFRRVFARRFGISPDNYRRRFAVGAE